MALPTNIFLGKAKAPTPQTKKQFSTHKPWDQPALSPIASPNDLGTPDTIRPEPVTPPSIGAANSPGMLTTVIAPDHEPRPNSDQSQFKLSPKPEHNPDQTQTKVSSTTETEFDPSFETQTKPRAQPRPQVRSNSDQSQTKLRSKSSFSSVVGLQRRLILFVFDASKTSREKLTLPIALKNLAESCQTTPMAAQVATRRLEQKELLHRREFKNGRGGWTRYELPNDLFQELLQFETQTKVSSNSDQSQFKLRAQPRSQPRPDLSSSSSSIDLENFKTTTTGEPELFESTAIQLTPEWSFLDVSPLAESGFTQTHLIQIVRQGKLTPIEVQDSIQFFAFDLKRNGKGNTLNGPPLNFFMGILRKGIPYAPPENYESPADEARRKTREFKERKDRERQAEEQKILDLEFSEWRRGLPAAELAALLPEFARKPGPMQDSTLKTHFEAEIWPERAQKLLGLNTFDRSEVGKQIEQSLQGAGQ